MGHHSKCSKNKSFKGFPQTIKKVSMEVTTDKDGKKIRSFTVEGEVILEGFMGKGIPKSNRNNYK